MIGLSRLLFGPTRLERLVTLAALLGRGAGFACVGYIVGGAIRGTAHPALEDMLFLTFVVVVVATTALEAIIYGRIFPFVEAGAVAFRRRMLWRLRALDWSAVRRIGTGALRTTLTLRVGQMTASVFMVGRLVINLAGVVGCVVVLAILSVPAALLVSAVLVAVLVRFLMVQDSVATANARAAEAELHLHTALQDLLLGFKELKLNEERAAAFMDEEIACAGHEVARMRANLAGRINATGFMLEIAVLMTAAGCLYLLPRIAPGSDGLAVSAALVTAVIPLAPFRDLSDTARMSEAWRRLAGAEAEVSAAMPARPVAGDRPTDDGPAPFRSLSFEAVTGRPADADNGSDTGFRLGPVSLTVRAGEILLVTGANGSGKSTLLGLAAGVLRPDGGRILINRQPVPVATHRRLVSAVFTDTPVFARLYGYRDLDPDWVQAMLSRCRIDDRVSYVDGRFSTTRLSTGQTKRLALACALIEGRPILVLDEWAAEQDPDHRQWFYTQLLPELAAQGRAILAVSHDTVTPGMAHHTIVLRAGEVVG